jgi:hypothetical protein
MRRFIVPLQRFIWMGVNFGFTAAAVSLLSKSGQQKTAVGGGSLRDG